MRKRAHKDAVIECLQLGRLNWKSLRGEKGTPATFILLDWCPKEEHSSDLQIEADREPEVYFMLR